MRRGIAATALVASLALTATACGGDSDSGDSADGPVSITWWDTSNATNEAPTYQALVKEFEAANKDVKVKYVNVPFDQAQNKFDTAAGSKGAPDVLRSEVGWTPAFAKKGFFLPLDGTEALKDQAKFKSNLIEQATYEDKVYGVPFVTDTLALVYNKELFEKAGRRGPQDLGRPEEGRRHDQGQDRRRRLLGLHPGLLRPVLPLRRGHRHGRRRRQEDHRQVARGQEGLRHLAGPLRRQGPEEGRHHRRRLRPHPGRVRQRQGRRDHPGPVGDHQLLQGLGLQGQEQPGHRHRPGRLLRHGGRSDRRPQPLRLRRLRRREAGGRAEVRELHDLGQGPGDHRAEELHAAHA